MILECPRCHRRVWTGKDGICPNCQGDVRDLSKIDPNMSVLTVRPDSVMPKVCCVCGVTTSRRVKIVSHRKRTADAETSGSAGDGIALSFLFGLLIPFFYLVGLAGSPRSSHVTLSLKMRVPQCDRCSFEKISPIEVDHERLNVKLLVHKDFKANFQLCNADQH